MMDQPPTDQASIVDIYSKIFEGRILWDIWDIITDELDLGILAVLSKKFPLLRTFLMRKTSLQSRPESLAFKTPVRYRLRKYSPDLTLFKSVQCDRFASCATAHNVIVIFDEIFVASAIVDDIQEFYVYQRGEKEPLEVIVGSWLMLYNEDTKRLYGSFGYGKQNGDPQNQIDYLCMNVGDNPLFPTTEASEEDKSLYSSQYVESQVNIGKDLIMNVGYEGERFYMYVSLDSLRDGQEEWMEPIKDFGTVEPIWIQGAAVETLEGVFINAYHNLKDNETIIEFRSAKDGSAFDWMIVPKITHFIGCYTRKKSQDLSEVRIVTYSDLSLMVYRFKKPKPMNMVENFHHDKDEIPETLYEPFSGPSGFLQVYVSGEPVCVPLEKLEGNDSQPFNMLDVFHGTRCFKLKKQDKKLWCFNKATGHFIGETTSHYYYMKFSHCEPEKFWNRVEKSLNMVNVGLNARIITTAKGFDVDRTCPELTYCACCLKSL